MINAIQPTLSIKESSFDELKSENRRDRFELFADQFKSMLDSEKKDNSSVAGDSENEKNQQTSENETQRIKADFTEFGERLKEIIQDSSNYLEFKFDKETNRMILRLIDSETKEVVQQFPPELALKIARIVSQLEGSGHITNAKI